MKPQPPSASYGRAPRGPRGTLCKISHKDRRPCTIMAPRAGWLAGWLPVARIYPVTSSATVMTRRSLLQLALYSACKPRVYVPFRAPRPPARPADAFTGQWRKNNEAAGVRCSPPARHEGAISICIFRERCATPTRTSRYVYFQVIKGLAGMIVRNLRLLCRDINALVIGIISGKGTVSSFSNI